MAWIIPGIISGISAISAGQQQGSALAKQNELIDYMLKKRREVYDPMERKTVIPGLMRRVEKGPFFAKQWANTAKYLRSPMRLGTGA